MDIGDVIHDMHYGTNTLHEKFVIKEHICIRTDKAYEALRKLLDDIEFDRPYINKMLVVVDYNSKGWVAAYSYDGRTFGVMVLTQKGETE